MKNTISLMIAIFWFSGTMAQVTLEHTYNYSATVVKLKPWATNIT